MDQYLAVPRDRAEEVRGFLNSRIWPCQLSDFAETFPDIQVVDSSEISRGNNLRGYYVGPSVFNHGALSVFRNITI